MPKSSERRIPPYERRDFERRHASTTAPAEEKRSQERRSADRRLHPTLSPENGNLVARKLRDLYPHLHITTVKKNRQVAGFKFRSDLRADIERVIHFFSLPHKVEGNGLSLTIHCSDVRRWPRSLRLVETEHSR